MSCHDFLDHLHACLDARRDGRPVPLPPALRDHLAACPLCRARDAAAGALDDALDRLPLPRLPADLADRLVDRLVAAALRDRRAHRLRRIVLTACAATSALAAGIFLAILLGSRPGPRPELAGPHPRVPEAVAPEPSPMPREAALPSVHDSMAEATAAAAALTRKAADDTLAPGRALWPEVRLPEPAPLAPSEATAASLRAATEGVSSSFQPLADSARRALTLFRRELPPRPPEDHSRL